MKISSNPINTAAKIFQNLQSTSNSKNKVHVRNEVEHKRRQMVADELQKEIKTNVTIVDRNSSIGSTVEKIPLSNLDGWIAKQNMDAYSGDFTDLGKDLHTGCIGTVNLDTAVQKSAMLDVRDPSSFKGWTAWLEDFRENGLDREISWSRLEMDFSTIADVHLTDWESAPEEVIDYYASKYVALEDQIKRDFQGQEQQEHLSRLQTVLETYTKAYANNLGETLGGFYENAGLAGEKQRIYQSVLESIQSKIGDYEQLVLDQPDYVTMDDERDQWLYRCSEYTASQLRNAGQKNHAPSQGVQEIQSLFDFAMAGTHLMRSAMTVNTNSLNWTEVEIGGNRIVRTMIDHKNNNSTIRAGIMMLEFEVLKDSAPVSQKHKDSLFQALQNKIAKEINGTDQKNVEKVIAETLKTYENTGDIRSAVETALTQGKEYGSVPNFDLVMQSLSNMFDRMGLDADQTLSAAQKMIRSVPCPGTRLNVAV